MPIDPFQPEVKVQRLSDQSAHLLLLLEDDNSGIINKFHHGTILYSLDSCYMFTYKKSYLVVVSEKSQKDIKLLNLNRS